MSEQHPEALSPAEQSVVGTPELNTGTDGIGLTEPHTEPIASARTLRWYVAALMLAPFFFLAACVVIMRSDFFIQHSQNKYLVNAGYGMTLHNADCQVLIYGDSSALVGVDPATIQKATGLSTCNIAEFAGMTMVNGTMVLDSYLAHNPRPRYLIFQFAPENLAPYPTWMYVGTYEAILFRMRQSLDAGMLRLTLQHSEAVLATAETSFRFALGWGMKKPLPTEKMHERELTHGRLISVAKPMSHCDPSARVHPPDKAWTDGLRKRYGVEGTTVLVNVTPVPDCEVVLQTYKTEFAPGTSIVDNALHTFPVNWYNTSGRLHMTTPGIAALSSEIVQELNRVRGAGGSR